MCKHLQEYKEAFPELQKLYVTALVTGMSSAAYESSFSTLLRVLTPYVTQEKKESGDLGPWEVQNK